jgi:hypothetical protein
MLNIINNYTKTKTNKIRCFNFYFSKLTPAALPKSYAAGAVSAAPPPPPPPHAATPAVPDMEGEAFPASEEFVSANSPALAVSGMGHSPAQFYKSAP